MCRPVKMPPSLAGAALACGNTPAVAPVTLSESVESATCPAKAPGAPIPHRTTAATILADNFRNSPSRRGRYVLNPINLSPRLLTVPRGQSFRQVRLNAELRFLDGSC